MLKNRVMFPVSCKAAQSSARQGLIDGNVDQRKWKGQFLLEVETRLVGVPDKGWGRVLQVPYCDQTYEYIQTAITGPHLASF